MQPQICHEYKYIYAHNGAKYDNILMLSKMLHIKEIDVKDYNGESESYNLTLDPFYNNNKMLKLTVKT
jgi:hypothetical protein